MQHLNSLNGERLTGRVAVHYEPLVHGSRVSDANVCLVPIEAAPPAAVGLRGFVPDYPFLVPR
jgi:hypothetical protein